MPTYSVLKRKFKLLLEGNAMKNSFKNLVSAIVVAVMIVLTLVPSFAASYVTIHLASNQYWTKGYGESHDPNYSLCGAMCHSVSPYSGSDNFHIMQCRVTNTYGDTISVLDSYSLSEGASSYLKIRIKEGYLNTNTVYFQFRGNSNSQAIAVVSYTGTVKTAAS